MHSVGEIKDLIKESVRKRLMPSEQSEFNQQISMSDGTYVGANLNEAVAFFNNPTNKDIRTAYENKLKMF